jgi:hypothetical protein
MNETRSAWRNASDQLSGLGRRLKAHYREQHGEENTAAEAVKHLAEAVQDAFDAMGTAAKDPEVKAEVKQVGQSLSHALGTTFAEASDELRKAFRSGTEGKDTTEDEAEGDAAEDTTEGDAAETEDGTPDDNESGPDEGEAPPKAES